MNLYIFADSDELEDFAEPLASSIAAWAEPKTNSTAVHRGEGTSLEPVTDREIELGLEISLSKPEKLKEPLNFLYKLAQEHKCEFVVGLVEENDYRDVCYFGFEEGRPDLFEIANYLSV
ncbi:hypothetical protein KO489_08535 [Reinekea forsetii]|nr:hypothetical protein [Reinekea forsetii]